MTATLKCSEVSSLQRSLSTQMRHLRLTKFPVCGGVLNSHISQRHTSYTVNPCIHMYTYPWAPLLGMMTVHHETSAGLNYMYVMEIHLLKGFVQCHARCMTLLVAWARFANIYYARARERGGIIPSPTSLSSACLMFTNTYGL